MSNEPSAVLEFWHSKHFYPPDHKGMAPAQGSTWVRTVRGGVVGPWRRVGRRSLGGALAAAEAAAVES